MIPDPLSVIGHWTLVILHSAPRRGRSLRPLLRVLPASFYLGLGSLLVALGTPVLTAATLTWDATSGTAGNQDGSGIWNTTTARWDDSSATWDNSTPDSAIFGAASGTAGTVTLGEAITVGGLTFNAAGNSTYTLAGGGFSLSTGTATATSVIVNAAATISAPITAAATNVLTKSGAATLTLAPTIESSFGQLKNSAGVVVLDGVGGTFSSSVTGGGLANTATTSTIRVTGGAWTSTVLGTNNGNSGFLGTLEVSGGSISFTSGRYFGATGGASYLNVSGGTVSFLNSIAPGNTQFSPGNGSAAGSGGATVTVSSGLLDIATASTTGGGNAIGPAFSSQLNQSGGTVRVGVTVGTSGSNPDLKIGGSVVNVRSAYTLGGGTLFMKGVLKAGGAPGAGGLNNFNFIGGTLVADTIITANLSHSSTATVAANQTTDATNPGFLFNSGGVLAPGDLGTAGRTVVTGNYIATGGALAVDLGGTTKATAFQTGQYDFVSVSGTVALGGELRVSVLPGFTPTATATFTILTAGSAPSGAFNNASVGSRFLTADGAGSFLLTRSGNSIVISQYQVVAPAVISTLTTLDAGTTQTFNAPRLDATSFAWTLDGVPVSTGNAFVYAPDIDQVGPHALVLDQTLPNGTHAIRQWKVTVKIPVPATSPFNYYVSPTGLDTNAGTTAGLPFKTLEKARDAIRALPKPLATGGVSVWLRGGTHFRTSTFALTTSDIGTATAPVIYRAYPGEKPVISGGKAFPASAFVPLAASEVGRVTPGVTGIVELNLNTNVITRDGPMPNSFGQSTLYNVYGTNSDGEMPDVMFNGKRMFLSRYPNHAVPTDVSDPARYDDLNTTNLKMNGVAAGADNPVGTNPATGYLNVGGTYTDGTGAAITVGGAFHYYPADAEHVSRWSTAIAKGGLWVQGYWRVPWQINGAKVKAIDPIKQVIAFEPTAAVTNGIGYKYTRPAGNYSEPWWVLNLLEEIDQPGEWAIDFSRNRLYFLPPAPITDGSFVISNVDTPLIQMTGGSHHYFIGLTFEHGLASAVQFVNGSRNLILGCEFRNMGNFPVDINGGTRNGVVSSDLRDLASGGIYLRGGNETASPRVPATNFAVNNLVENFARVTRVYAAGLDIGSGGGSGGGSHTTAVGMRAANNRIRGTPHGGVLHGSWDNIFEYNDVSDFCLVSDDLGGFYSYDLFSRHGNQTFRYNFVHDSDIGNAFYFDHDHRDMHLYGNVTNLRSRPNTQGISVWYKVGGQLTLGQEQFTDCFNNLAVNSLKGFIFYGANPAMRIENNATVAVSPTPFSWTLVTPGTTANTAAASTAAVMATGSNLSYTSDIGFINEPANDMRLKPDSRLYDDLPDFKPIPFEMIGLFNDDYRTDGAIYTPFVLAGSASNVGGNTVTLNGTLVYPTYNDNTQVTVYWGTTDGGTNPGSWQNSLDLGVVGSGSLSNALVSLSPNTRHFFRYRAVNAAGTSWGTASNSFTTYPLANAATGGTASASTGTGADAFDGNAATAWTATAATGTLHYQLPTGTTSVVTRYTVTSAATSPAKDPRDWQFQASSDGLVWITLDTRTGETFTSRGQTKTYDFGNTTAYGFYRFNITANSGDATSVQLGEMTFQSPAITADVTPPVITTPGNLSLAANSFDGSQVNFTVTAIDIVSGNALLTVTPPSGSTFPAGVTTVNVSAVDAAGNSATANFTVTVTSPGLPSPWLGADIGTVLQPGRSAAFVTDIFSVSAAGRDIWNTSDAFHFVYRSLTGDGVLTARVSSLDTTGAKAGVMMRNGTGATAANAFVHYTPSKATFQQRTGTNVSSTNVTATTKANMIRLRLMRRGNVFTGYASPDLDGLDWQPFTDASGNPVSTTITMNSTIQVGLALTARDTGSLGFSARAAFDEIELVTPTAAPTGLTATVLADTHIRLVWNDVASNENHYTINRSPAGAGTWTLVTTLPAGSGTYTDTSLAPSTNYDFRVTAANEFFTASTTVTRATPAAIGDGISGAWRYQYFGNGTAVISGVSGSADNPDGDELTNLQEYLAGTDPTSSASTLKSTLGIAGTDFQISFPTVLGKFYLVERTTDLSASPWPTIVLDNIAGTGGTLTVTDTNVALPSRIFYRVRLKP